MSIKQNGGVFGRNPTFNDVTIEGQLTFDGDIDINSDLKVDGDLDVTGSGSFASLDVFSAGIKANSNASIGFQLGNDSSGSTDIGKIFNNAGRFAIEPAGSRSFAIRTGATKVDSLVVDHNNHVKISTGNLVIGTSGQGIDFSATAGTGTSELFDDYEEGTWAPNFAVNGFSGSPTVSASSGTYTKVGRVVTVFWSVTLSTAAYMSSYSQINNLPFAATVGGTCGSYATGSIGGNVIGSFGSISTSNLFLFQSISTSTSTSWDGSHTYIAT